MKKLNERYYTQKKGFGDRTIEYQMYETYAGPTGTTMKTVINFEIENWDGDRFCSKDYYFDNGIKTDIEIIKEITKEISEAIYNNWR